VNSAKRRRQAILAAIAAQRIETQEQMVEALHQQGIEASQASVSRDITGLHLVKVDGRWMAPPQELPTRDPLEERIAGRLLSVTPAGDHLLVLKTPPGEAQGVALAIDRLDPEGVVGTLAGDDAIFVAVVDADMGEIVSTWLQGLIPEVGGGTSS